MNAHEVLRNVIKIRTMVRKMGSFPVKIEMTKRAFDTLSAQLIGEKAPPTPGADRMLGIPVYVDASVPDGVLRIHKSDGKIEEVTY